MGRTSPCLNCWRAMPDPRLRATALVLPTQPAVLRRARSSTDVWTRASPASPIFVIMVVVAADVRRPPRALAGCCWRRRSSSATGRNVRQAIWRCRARDRPVLAGAYRSGAVAVASMQWRDDGALVAAVVSCSHGCSPGTPYSRSWAGRSFTPSESQRLYRPRRAHCRSSHSSPSCSSYGMAA